MSGGDCSFGPELGLFALRTVLFPGGMVSLRVFEPRYLDMVGRCLKAREGFGVVAIRAGSEVGEADTFTLGTGAEIVDWNRDQSGLLGIVAAGRGRFRVISRYRQKDGLYVGQVTWIDEADADLPQRHASLAGLLKTALTRADAVVGDANFGSAGWVGHRLAETLPFDLATKQRLLEHQDPVARLDELASLLEELRQLGG